MSKIIPLSMLKVIDGMAKRGVPIKEEAVDVYLTGMYHHDPANWYTSNEPPDQTVRKIFLSGNHAWEERPAAVKHIQRKDLYIASAGVLHMHSMPNAVGDDNIYRVSVFPEGVDIVCFGLDSVDSCLEGHYDDINNLPDWVKERLAILNMMSSTPPTNEVAGVGRRISGHVYWVYRTVAADASTSA
jgi:hypothetical protein